MSPERSAALLSADRVSRRFGAVVAVDDVSLAVEAGEIVGLLGANGAGKTTLIRMLLGLLEPSAGVVSMFGATPSRRSRRRLGYVSQGLGLYRDMTVRENVEFNASTYGIDADRIVLPEELSSLGDQLVGAIGLGRQRQLAFSCALGHSPELLVLDEPTSGVDPLARARLWDAIRAQAGRGVGVLVTTHYMQEAQQCDRLVLLAAGSIAASGTVADIVAGRTVVEVDAGSWASAFAALDAAGLDLMLAGRRIRVAGVDSSEVRRVLSADGIDAVLTVVPAVLDEAMVAVGRDPRAP